MGALTAEEYASVEVVWDSLRLGQPDWLGPRAQARVQAQQGELVQLLAANTDTDMVVESTGTLGNATYHEGDRLNGCRWTSE